MAGASAARITGFKIGAAIKQMNPLTPFYCIFNFLGIPVPTDAPNGLILMLSSMEDILYLELNGTWFWVDVCYFLEIQVCWDVKIYKRAMK